MMSNSHLRRGDGDVEGDSPYLDLIEEEAHPVDASTTNLKREKLDQHPIVAEVVEVPRSRVVDRVANRAQPFAVVVLDLDLQRVVLVEVGFNEIQPHYKRRVDVRRQRRWGELLKPGLENGQESVPMDRGAAEGGDRDSGDGGQQ
jgi:hypothetical protein